MYDIWCEGPCSEHRKVGLFQSDNVGPCPKTSKIAIEEKTEAFLLKQFLVVDTSCISHYGSGQRVVVDSSTQSTAQQETTATQTHAAVEKSDDIFEAAHGWNSSKSNLLFKEAKVPISKK